MDMAIVRRAHQTLGQRARARRKRLKLTQTALASMANINQGFLSEIERDKRKPGPKTLAALSIALDIPEAVLIGEGTEHDAPQPLEMRDLPLFGTIPAGPPDRSQEQMELFPVLRHMWAADRYCLKLTFDSMEPTLKPGDVVLVHYRPDVDPAHVPGRVCACLVDGSPTLKRVTVEVRNGERVILLRGDNPQVPPLLIDSTHDFSIQGVVIKLVSRDL